MTSSLRILDGSRYAYVFAALLALALGPLAVPAPGQRTADKKEQKNGQAAKKAPPARAEEKAADKIPVPAGSESGTVLEAAAIEAELKSLETATDLDDAVKKTLTDFYARALEQVRSADGWAKKAAAFEAESKKAPDELASIRKELAKEPDDAPVAPSDKALIEQIEPIIRKELAKKRDDAPIAPSDKPLIEQIEPIERKSDQAKADVTQIQGQVDSLAKQADERPGRREEIPKLVSEAKQRLDEVSRQLESKPTEGEAPALTRARRTESLARKHALDQEIGAYGAELRLHEATSELLTARREWEARRLSMAQKQASFWSAVVSVLRQKKAAASLAEATRKAEDAQSDHPIVKKLADDNKELAKERTKWRGIKWTGGDGNLIGLIKNIQKAKDYRADLEASNKALGLVEDEVKRRTKIESLQGVIGPWLRKQRPDEQELRDHIRKIEERKPEIVEARKALVEKQDLLSSLDDFDEAFEAEAFEAVLGGIDNPATRDDQFHKHLKAVEAVLGGIDDRATRREIDNPETRDQIDEHLKKRDPLLKDFIADLVEYGDALDELDVAEAALIDKTQALAQSIDEKIFWIRSTTPLPGGDLPEHTGGALQWLTDPEAWTTSIATLWTDWQNRLAVGVFGIVLIGLVALQRRFRVRVRALGEQVLADYTGTVRLTLLTLWFTLLMAMVWPTMMFVVGWRTAWGDSSEFADAIGTALMTTATVFLMTEAFRQICRSKGLGEAHFRWRPAMLQQIRRTAYWLMVTELPIVFIVIATDYQAMDEWGDSLGRLSFLVGLAIFTVFAHRISHPSGVVMQELVAGKTTTLFARGRPVWYALVVGAPIVLAVLAIMGYYYTALQLAFRLQITLWMILGVFVFNAMMVRWLFAARGKLAIEQVRRQREAAEEEEKSEIEADREEIGGVQTQPVPSDEPEVDLSAVNVQTRKLLSSAIFAILLIGFLATWVDVLPALAVVIDVELWGHDATELRGDRQANGEVEYRPVSVRVSTTLADVALALIVIALTVIASRNIPGLLEITLLQRLPLDASIRYAATTISRYLITIVGIISACALFGLRWSSVQWLAAAVTVGLGFGLQEIVANFVSGLILLFERPIRVGDIVTVEGVSGVVSRIRMRATTITDWDRKDYIVPNKEFITGRLLNWTLTNKINRVVINVGVAYGSDTTRARKLLYEIVEDNPYVMKDPAPLVTFEGFGDSTLDMVVRCYLPDLDNRLGVIHDLHTTIHEKFNEAGIEIAFPQRDLHIRSVSQPLLASTVAADGNGKGGGAQATGSEDRTAPT